MNARRILIFRIGELGDTLIALPALRVIRNSFPTAHIALLSNLDSQGRHVSPRQILPENGIINEWIQYSTGPGNKLLNPIRLLWHLRRGRYDLLVYLAPRLRNPNAIRRDLLFFRLSGISDVVGHEGIVPLPSRSSDGLPTVEHETDHLLQRLSLADIPVPAAGNADFDLDLTDEELRTSASWFSQHVPTHAVDNVVAFGPGSKWLSKIWPEERFLEVGHRLIAEANIFPVVFGGAEDAQLGQRLVKTWGRGANAAGALTVRQAACVLSKCRVYVGNDTGTMHLAAAVGTPCVAIMPALDWPGHWSPYGSGHTVLRKHVPCEGCLLSVCTAEGLRCLKEIKAEEVVEASLKILTASQMHVPSYV